MSLAEILKRKLSQPKEIKIEEKAEDVIEYKAVVSFSTPDEELFLALYTPFLKDPYKFDWFIFRDFSAYILESSCYVLNTFPKMDETEILKLFIERFSPTTFTEYAKIIHFVSHICLCVPASYETRIREIIQKI